MPSNISGVGFVAQRVDGILYPMLASTFSFAEERTTQDAMGYPVNSVSVKQVTDTVTTESVWTVTMGVESLDAMDISALIFDQKAYAGSNVVIPVLTSGTVPSSPGPYTLTVTGLIEDQEVEITMLSDSDPGKVSLTQIASSGTPASGEFDVTANTITFHSSAAGKNVVIYYRKTQGSLSFLGGTAAANPYGAVEIFGKYKTTRTGTRNIWFPRCTVNAGVSFDVTADSFEKEYKASVPTDLGFTVPYMEWQTP